MPFGQPALRSVPRLTETEEVQKGDFGAVGTRRLTVVRISVDTDHNDADVLLNAKPVFIVAENLFCSFLTCSGSPSRFSR
eukprot:3568406-Amphidinium_carterae.1